MKPNKYRIPITFFIFYLLLGCADVLAQEGYYFKQLSLNEGLTQSTVRCMLHDRRGFLWIGTRSGLNRSDRNKLKSYYFKQNDSGSIPGNQINFLAEDREGNVWVGTGNGLALYDPATDKFRTISYQNKPLAVHSAVQLPQGMIFGGAGILYRYDFAKNRVVEIPTLGKEKSIDQFHKMVPWHHDQVLLQTRRDGMWLFNTKDKSLKRALFIEDQELMALHVNQRKEIWISPYGKGIKGYDKNGQLIRQYNSENSGLNNDVVLDILEQDNKRWLATDGGGINILDLQTGLFSILQPVSGHPGSLPENSILTLYHDHEDNLWAGTIRGGLLSIQKTFMNTYRNVTLGGSHGLSHKTVLSIHDDLTGFLWIGTDGGGINRFDIKKSTFKHYLPTQGLKVASITEFSNKELLIYVFDKGLYLFDKQTGHIKRFENISLKQQDHINSFGISINVSRVNNQYIFLFADQIARYHLPSGKIEPVAYNSKSNAYSALLKVYSDKTVTYLFGPYGIFELNHERNTIQPLYEFPANGNPIKAAARDKRGIFWIGSRNGLMYYDPKYKRLNKIYTGLFNEVSTLVIDKQDRLWIGAQNMLFSYNIRENKFVAFDESDGVLPNELFYKASIAAENGNTYLGGVEGLLEIKKNIAVNALNSPEVKLMTMEVNGAPLLAEGNKVTVPWDHTSLIVKVMAKEKDVFRKRMFRYKIAGLDSRVIETYDHALSLGSLPVGHYEILVSCNLKSGGWSKYSKVLAIEVTAPWFQQFWFIALLLLLIAASFAVFYKMAIAKRERKLQWDMKEHKQRTDEAKINFLIHISHELRTPLTLIYSPLRRMLKEKNLNVELSRILEGIYRQAGNMRNIIDMVLDLQKIELAHEQLKLESHDLNEWIFSVVENFSGELAEKGIALHYDLDAAVQQLVFDNKKCSLVLTNLMANALKFSSSNTTIRVRTSCIQHFVRVAIEDEGIGLAHVDIHQLFKPFYQGAHQEAGSGIGVSYSKTLVEMHGGNIGAINNKGKGATFYFELPIDLQSVTSGTVLDPQPVQAVSEFPTSGYTLLIVEDVPELLLFLKNSLEPHFKEIIQAANGLDALALIEQKRPDIILSDVMMPGIDGFELCKRLKEDLYVSHTPFVLLTTQGDAESRNLGYKLGADAYIAKPFDLDYLHTILANLLKNRELVKARYKHSAVSIPVQEGTFSRADELFMVKLNSLITENIESKELHVDFLIDKMAMSRATLYNKLKSIADIGVNDYINKLRLERAADLLKNTDKSIMEIADGLGFNNQRYFSTVFKQSYGCTPTAYRNTQ